MSQDNLIAAAQQAHPQALAIVLNRLLKSRGVQARVQRQGADLKILVEAKRLPDQTAIANGIRDRLDQLGIQSIQTVKLYGYQTGATFPIWTQTLPLRFGPESQLETTPSPPVPVLIRLQGQPAEPLAPLRQPTTSSPTQRRSPRANPWGKFRVRSILLWAILFSMILSLGWNLLIGAAGLEFNDPIGGVISGLAIYGLLYIWALGQFRTFHINHQRVIGNIPKRYPWWRPLGLVAAIFLFSLGSFQIAFYGISFWFPNLVESILNNDLVASAHETAYPRLTHLLQIFMVVAAAPVVEEFLFRGIILHRWAEKWGPSKALWSSAFLFGVLHANFVGLTMFGLVMGLLYLRTRTLIVPIVCHAFNNAIAIAFNLLPGDSPDPTLTLEQFRAGWWMGVVCLTLALPWLLQFILRNWPHRDAQFPYGLNSGQSQNRFAALNASLANLSPFS